MKNTKT